MRVWTASPNRLGVIHYTNSLLLALVLGVDLMTSLSEVRLPEKCQLISITNLNGLKFIHLELLAWTSLSRLEATVTATQNEWSGTVYWLDAVPVTSQQCVCIEGMQMSISGHYRWRLCAVCSVSRLYSVLEMVLSNTSVVDNVVDILNDVGSLSNVVDSMRAVSDSCKFTVLSL